MKPIRIIPRLDIKGPHLVKGIHMEGLRVLGQPQDFAYQYYTDGADELIYMDVVASLYGRNSLLEVIRQTSERVFIPLTVGGGIRTLQDIRQVLRAGADKVAINTAAIANPPFITEAAREFGSSTIIVSIEAYKKDDGTYEAYTDNGRNATGFDAISWAKRVEELGAGEILLTSINAEGRGRGFDVSLTEHVARAVNIPVIAAGGAGKREHVEDVITKGKADAVCLASILHYHYVMRGEYREDFHFEKEGNREFLKNKRPFKLVDDASLDEIKEFLHNKQIGCRYEGMIHHG